MYDPLSHGANKLHNREVVAAIGNLSGVIMARPLMTPPEESSTTNKSPDGAEFRHKRQEFLFVPQFALLHKG